MASEILGLFGTQNPQQLQQDYLANLSVSPAQMGSQGLLQQLVSTGANAGTMMGYGAGRLLGGKVAGEVEANYLDQAIKVASAGKTPAEKMKLLAAELEGKPGMGAQYMKALSEARRLEAEDMTMADAKFKSENRTRERKETRMVFNPLTQKNEPKQFYWTEDYIDGKWVKASSESTTPTGDAGAEGNKPQTEQEKAKAELDRQLALKANKGGGGSRGDATREVSPEFTGRSGLEAANQRMQQERAAEQRASQDTQAEVARLLDRTTPTFNTLAEKENALRAAVKAGNYGLASQINKSPPFRKY